MINNKEKIKLAQRIKASCVQAAHQGFKNASMRGLCNEGAVEAAVSAIERLKMEEIIEE